MKLHFKLLFHFLSESLLGSAFWDTKTKANLRLNQQINVYVTNMNNTPPVENSVKINPSPAPDDRV